MSMARMVRILFITISSTAIVLSCSEDKAGTCVSSGGIVDSCKPNFTRGECEEWNDESVNGANWSFSTTSCASRGFTVKCSEDATHVRTASDC